MNDFEFIKGFENLYKINLSGNIWSCWYSKIMKPQVTKDGYLFVSLKREGKRYKSFIHRLLALQYLENTETLPQIDHIDRNKQNNNLDNLRWCSQHTNRLNRTDLLCLKTEEELKNRADKSREYKKLKAREYALKKRLIAN